MTRVDPVTVRHLLRIADDPAIDARTGQARRHLTGLGSDGERTLETQLRQTGATGWVRELRFDSVRKWSFDFAWPDLAVAVEVEGGTWISGRHSQGAGFRADCMKYAEAAIRGWTVIRVTTDMVTDGTAITLIGRLLWSASQRRNDRG